MDPSIIKQTLVPIVAIVTGLLALLVPVMLVYLVLQFRERRQQAVLQVVRQLVEQGLAIPPELLDPPRNSGKATSTPLFRTMTTLGAGVGTSALFYLMGLEYLVGVGVLLICIGVAQLIAYRVEGPRGQQPKPD